MPLGLAQALWKLGFSCRINTKEYGTSLELAPSIFLEGEPAFCKF